jgi:hypothetical protein
MAANYPPEEVPPEQPQGGGLSSQMGPLPLWGWLGIGGAVLVFIVWRRSKSAASAASGTVGATNGPTTAGQPSDQQSIADELALLENQVATIQTVQGAQGPPGPAGPPGPGGPSPSPPGGTATAGGQTPKYVVVTKWFPGNPTGDLWDIFHNAGLTLAQGLALPFNAQYRSHPNLVYAGNKVQVGWQ